MTSQTTSPTIPSVSTGTPPKEWSDSMLASGAHLSASDTPTKSQTIPGEFNANSLDEPNQQANVSPRKQASTTQGPEQHRDAASMPSGEVTGTQPGERVGGVGALPGNVSESGVAYLPEERRGRDESSAFQSASQSPGKQSTKHAHAFSKVPRKEEQEHHLSMPSEEVKGAQPREHTGGVGALPGNASESAVALLPEERQEKAAAGSGETQPRKSEVTFQQVSTEPTTGNDKVYSADTSEAPKGRQTDDAGQASPTGEKEKEKELGTTQGDQGKGPARDEQEEENQQAGPLTKEDYGADYHPAELHPPPPGSSVADQRNATAGKKEEEHESSSSSSTQAQDKRSSAGSGKKPGFMAMVKGEMKVLAGKMSKDDEKVAEGKKLMQKEDQA